jgi:hypothetical protein
MDAARALALLDFETADRVAVDVLDDARRLVRKVRRLSKRKK